MPDTIIMVSGSSVSALVSIYILTGIMCLYCFGIFYVRSCWFLAMVSCLLKRIKSYGFLCAIRTII